MAKIKVDSALLSRAKKFADEAGYGSVEEFVTHLIESELSKHETGETDEKTAEQLRGLGYID